MRRKKQCQDNHQARRTSENTSVILSAFRHRGEGFVFSSFLQRQWGDYQTAAMDEKDHTSAVASLFGGRDLLNELLLRPMKASGCPAAVFGSVQMRGGGQSKIKIKLQESINGRLSF